ncbi:ATP-binding protein [Clostridium sp. Maddingley MBC34-26]|uniref:ATP-binding protein n=1 Tax=Clostridium sp. Maddingley MBC34-26 TaxID=1196322 RepID=UPI0024202D37|nr:MULTISPECIES: ATP-binding protein [unclassified Clostridium]
MKLFVITSVIYFKLRNNMNRYIFISIECFLILSAISEMFLMNVVLISNWINITGHIIKAIAAYFLYKGVVETCISRPYNLLSGNLEDAGDKLKLFEEIITQNEQCASLLINNCDDVVFVLSENKFVFANKKMAELLGVERIENIINTNVDRIIISIEDDGVGISYDKLDTIFERFEQVDKTLVRNTKGSGIGLSLVKSIVEMHGGNIKVDKADKNSLVLITYLC